MRGTSGSPGDAGTPASRSTVSAGGHKKYRQNIPTGCVSEGKQNSISSGRIDQSSSNVELQYGVLIMGRKERRGCGPLIRAQGLMDRRAEVPVEDA